jgi:hypothetical protein
MATLGDGCFYSFRHRTLTTGYSGPYQFNVDGNLANAQPRDDNTDNASQYDSKVRGLRFTHNVVMPMAYQKFCWRRMCRTLKSQVSVSEFHVSLRMVNIPEKEPLASGIPAARVSVYR